jgi:hypothetical protein
MGERGHTVHILDAVIGHLASIGHRIAVLGNTERWTTFVPTEASTFDGGRASRIAGRPLVHVWFDEDVGVSVQVYSSGDLVGELSLPGEDAEVTESDFAFTATLEELGVLSRVQRAALLKRMSDVVGLREWTMNHGLERLLGLPFFEPLPADLPERELVELLPAAASVIEATVASKTRRVRAKARAPKAAAASKSPPPKESWSEKDKATLDLHCEYWAAVFSMNNWKLYNRYKKHLPADERRGVDELCNAVAVGDDPQVHQRVKRILARIWACEDWDAVIRDPALIDSEGDVWDEWRARLSS